jgi:hypothetical protein
MIRLATGLDRAVAALGVLALACAATSPLGGELDLRIRGWGLVATLVLGVVAIAGGWVARRPLALISGLGFLIVATVQIIQLGGRAGEVEHGALGGNASTFAVWLGLGIGLVVVGLANRYEEEIDGD